MSFPRTFVLLTWLCLAALLTGCSYRYRRVAFPDGTSVSSADRVFARIQAVLRSAEHRARAKAEFPFLEEEHWRRTGVEIV